VEDDKSLIEDCQSAGGDRERLSAIPARGVRTIGYVFAWDKSASRHARCWVGENGVRR
jgi:hypothetical protein